MGSVSSSVLVRMEVQILVFSLNLLNPLGTGEAHDSWVHGGVFWPVYVGGSCGGKQSLRGC